MRKRKAAADGGEKATLKKFKQSTTTAKMRRNKKSAQVCHGISKRIGPHALKYVVVV